MSADETPFLGEIRMFSFGVTPKDWLPCNGQLLFIQQSLALFTVIGTAYGGDGRTTFGLPDLRARVPRHVEAGAAVGRPGGSDAVTLTTSELPIHNHTVFGSNTGGVPGPGPDSQLSNDEPGNLYGPANNLVGMNVGMVGVTGGFGAHENRQPFLALNFCICIAGVFPRHTLQEA